jgi:hypothetical protein
VEGIKGDGREEGLDKRGKEEGGRKTGIILS